MKILVPTHPVLHGGGIATVVRGAVPALRAAAAPDDEVIVISPPVRARSALSKIGRARGGFARLVYEQARLPLLAREADSVHVFDARAPLATSRPFVLTVHDVSYLDHPEWFSPGAARYKALMLRASLARRPAAVVCDSQLTRERLLVHHPSAAKRSRVVVVPPGVEPAPSHVEPLVEPEPYFLTVATLEPRKNHLELLRAFRRARREGLAARWKVVGADGHCASVIRPPLEATEGVDLLGEVSQPELERLYAGALFVAVPSLLEGFGYPPLEAMARGIPVVASTNGVFDETLGDAALREPPVDTDAWAGSLLKLERDQQLREQLSRVGRDQAEKFPWQTTADGLWSLHCEAVRSG